LVLATFPHLPVAGPSALVLVASLSVQRHVDFRNLGRIQGEGAQRPRMNPGEPEGPPLLRTVPSSSAPASGGFRIRLWLFELVKNHQPIFSAAGSPL
jgi:hypothetical protein